MAKNNERPGEAFFRQGNEYVTLGKHIAAARAFRSAAAAGHAEAPQDCSVLIDAMIGGTYEAARAVFRRGADGGNPFAACCHFLSWTNFRGELKNFDLVYAAQALKQAQALNSAHASQSAAEFYGKTAYSVEFKEFMRKIKKCAEKDLEKINKREKLEHGETECLRVLGDIYCTGTGTRADKKKAAFYYSAASGTDAVCSLRLGLIYLKGEIHGRTSDIAEIFGLFSEHENAPSESFLEAGKLILSNYKDLGKKQEEAVPYIEKAAGQGNMEARRILGKMLFYGRLMPQDKELGLKLIDEAHVSGNRTASLDSGLAYYFHGLLQKEANLKIAMERFSSAAGSGIAEGWKMLGRMFLLGETGEGRTGRGKKDETHARKCFDEAVSLGDITAAYDLAQIFYSRAGAADFAKAYELFSKLAAAGHAQSQYRAALMLAEGLGTDADIRKASHFLHEASSQGHAEATWKLFEFSLLEKPAKEKPGKILDLLLLALKQGSISACLFVKNGKKSDHLPVMLKESIFGSFLCNMKELMLLRKKSGDAIRFFIFALKNADLIVPLKSLENISGDYLSALSKEDPDYEERRNRILMAELGKEIMGSGKMPCSAVIKEVSSDRIMSAEKFFPGKKESSAEKAKKEIFCFFSRIENVPLSWRKKYRFLQLPAQKILEIFFRFKMEHGFPYALALDPCGKMLLFHEAGLYMMDTLLSMTEYFVPPPPEEYRW